MADKFSYFELVYEVAKHIPKGKITSYGAIADYLALGSARMVGWALYNSSAVMDGIPAHRVLNRKGELSGRNHFDTPTRMEELLEMEGVEIEDNKVKDLKAHFWHPEEIDKLL